MEFSKKLVQLRRKARLNRYRLSELSKVDGSYLARLEAGVQTRPGRKVVISLGQALLDHCPDIREKDIDALLKSAGHFPLRQRQINITGR